MKGVGGGSISGQTIAAIIKNPIYKGEMRSVEWDLTVQGRHEPLVDAALWEQAQNKRQSASSRNRFNPDFPLRRFVKCGSCGRSLTGSKSRGRNAVYPYYRCITPACLGSVRAGELERLFGQFLESHALRGELVPLVKESLRQLISEKTKRATEERARIFKQVGQNEEQQERLILSFTDGKIGEQEYSLALPRLRRAGEVLRARLNELASPDIDQGQIDACIDLLAAARNEWESVPAHLKTRFQGLVFPSGVTFAEGKFGTAETSQFYGLNLHSVVVGDGLASPPGTNNLYTVPMRTRVA